MAEQVNLPGEASPDGGWGSMAEQVNLPGEASPDGGWGWMIVAGCFITTICTRAVTRCVSIFFVEFQTHFSRDYSGTAWIQALVDCTTMLCAPLGSYLGNRWSSRVAVMAGGLLSSAGLILSSFATSLEFLYLSLGILTGVGFALCYTPAIATVGVYFRQRKALAYGIAMSGSSIGTFVLAPVVQLLIELYSWRGALLILGGVSLHLCACGALMRPLVGLGRSQSHAVEERGCEVDVLKTRLAEAKLHKELNLEDTKIQQYKLETAELNGIIINRDKVTTGDPGEEDRGKEQAKCLLGHGNLDETGVKLIDLPQRDTNLEKKKHEEEPAEDPVLTDKDTTKKLKVNSKTGDAECILEKTTTRFSKRNTNGKFISVNPTILKTEQYASLSPTAPTNSVLVDSKLPDTNQAVSQLPDSELAGLALANTKLPDSELAGLALANTKLPDSELAGLVLANTKLPDTELAGLALANTKLPDTELAGLALANTKLPDTEPLCEMLCCTPLFINNAKCKSREEERYFCLQVTQEYRFLLTSEFLLLAVSFLFLAFGCNVPFVHLVAYTLSIGAEPQQAALVMSIMGMMGIVGNISFGWISDRKCLRAFRVVSYLLAVGLDGLSCLCLPMLRTFPLLVPFALFYGYFDGAYVALIPVVTANIVGTTYFPTALGMVYFLHAIPYLISPPIGGWLVDQTNSYTPAFLLGGSSLICSALILATVILSRHSCRGRSHSYIRKPL